MKPSKKVEHYPPVEELINITSHAAGFFLSFVALFLLYSRASQYDDIWMLISFSIFGLSLIILYAASMVYHSVKEPALRNRLQVLDHAAIYVLIAGSYTPFTLVTLQGGNAGITGWVIFAASWGMASLGIALKLFFTGHFNLLSTLMYVFMGWIIVFAIEPMIENLPPEGLYWLVAGGLSYTLGAVLYAIEKIHFNHAIFHVFVLLGSFCHFIAVYSYVRPVT